MGGRRGCFVAFVEISYGLDIGVSDYSVADWLRDRCMGSARSCRAPQAMAASATRSLLVFPLAAEFRDQSHRVARAGFYAEEWPHDTCDFPTPRRIKRVFRVPLG